MRGQTYDRIQQGSPANAKKGAVLDRISEALDRLKYGDIVIRVVDGKVMFVDVNERHRIS